MSLDQASMTPAHISTRLMGAMVASLVLWGCSFTETEEGALERGDVAWARGDLQEALAEYRLALSGDRENSEILARVAHAYARQGRLDEARDRYRQAVFHDSAWADQAASDMVGLARDAEARGDRFEVASALQAALEFRPGVAAEELALPLARHHARSGEYGKALPYFRNALRAVTPDSAPEVVFETAMAHEEIGDCRRALVFFEQYRDIVPRWERSEVDWHIGSCSYRLAMDIRAGRDRGPFLVNPDSADAPDPLALPEGTRPIREPVTKEAGDTLTRRDRAARNLEALRLVERTITVGEPRNLQALAYFEKGEILAERGECDAAVEAYRRVLLEDPAGSGPLVSRAQERIDQVRFGPRPGEEDRVRRRRSREPSDEAEGARRLTPCGTPMGGAGR